MNEMGNEKKEEKKVFLDAKFLEINSRADMANKAMIQVHDLMVEFAKDDEIRSKLILTRNVIMDICEERSNLRRQEINRLFVENGITP